jgi:hypothetical protein
MAFIPNKQEANSPQANASTTSQELAVAKGGAGNPNEVLLYATGLGLSPLVDDAYYLIVQNVGTVNLDLAFNNSVTGIILYPAATFECAVSQGTEIWAINASTTTDSSLRVIAFR